MKQQPIHLDGLLFFDKGETDIKTPKRPQACDRRECDAADCILSTQNSYIFEWNKKQQGCEKQPCRGRNTQRMVT